MSQQRFDFIFFFAVCVAITKFVGLTNGEAPPFSTLLVANNSQPPSFQWLSPDLSTIMKNIPAPGNGYIRMSHSYYDASSAQVYLLTVNQQRITSLDYNNVTARRQITQTASGICVDPFNQRLVYAVNKLLCYLPTSNLSAAATVLDSSSLSALVNIACNNNDQLIAAIVGSQLQFYNYNPSGDLSIKVPIPIGAASGKLVVYNQVSSTYYVITTEPAIRFNRNYNNEMMTKISLNNSVQVDDQSTASTASGTLEGTDYVYIATSAHIFRILVSYINGSIISWDSITTTSSIAPGVAFASVDADILPPTSPVTRSIVTFDADPTFTISAAAGDPRSTSPVFGAFNNTDTPKKSFLFPALWTKVQVVNNETFAYTYDSMFNGTTTNVRLAYTYNPFNNLSIVLPDANQYTLAPGTLKFSLSINGSQIATELFNNNPSLNLTWSACFSHSYTNSSFTGDYTATDLDGTTLYAFDGTNDALLTLRVPHVAVVDGTTTRIVQNISSVAISSNKMVICAVWTFPYFTSSLIYDPDLGVLGSGESSTGNGAGGDGDGINGGDGSSDKWIIAAVVVPVVVALLVIIVLIVLVVIIVIFVWQKVKWRSGGSQINSINYDPDL